MIAKKELKTIYFLANRLAIYSDKKIPANCRGISKLLKQAGMINSKFLDRKGNDFTKHIDNIVTERNEQFKSSNERLYYEFTDKMIERLLENKYIIETKDWNRKTGKIKLSGPNGNDRICKSHFHSGVGYVFFNVEKPYDHILQYLTEEKDIDVLVEKIQDLEENLADTNTRMKEVKGLLQLNKKVNNETVLNALMNKSIIEQLKTLSTKQVAKEDDPELVAGKANIIAARVDDYKNDETYKAKIDVLTDAVLSKAVADYVNEKWGGAITCDSSSQIDLR
jgi:hypothetical protein